MIGPKMGASPNVLCTNIRGGTTNGGGSIGGTYEEA